MSASKNEEWLDITDAIKTTAANMSIGQQIVGPVRTQTLLKVQNSQIIMYFDVFYTRF